MDEDSEIGMREVAERRPIKTLAQSSENPADPIKGACPWQIKINIRWTLSFPQSRERIQNTPLWPTKLQSSCTRTVPQSRTMGRICEGD